MCVFCFACLYHGCPQCVLLPAATAVYIMSILLVHSVAVETLRGEVGCSTFVERYEEQAKLYKLHHERRGRVNETNIRIKITR